MSERRRNEIKKDEKKAIKTNLNNNNDFSGAYLYTHTRIYVNFSFGRMGLLGHIKDKYTEVLKYWRT